MDLAIDFETVSNRTNLKVYDQHGIKRSLPLNILLTDIDYCAEQTVCITDPESEESKKICEELDVVMYNRREKTRAVNAYKEFRKTHPKLKFTSSFVLSPESRCLDVAMFEYRESLVETSHAYSFVVFGGSILQPSYVKNTPENELNVFYDTLTGYDELSKEMKLKKNHEIHGSDLEVICAYLKQHDNKRYQVFQFCHYASSQKFQTNDIPDMKLFNDNGTYMRDAIKKYNYFDTYDSEEISPGERTVYSLTDICEMMSPLFHHPKSKLEIADFHVMYNDDTTTSFMLDIMDIKILKPSPNRVILKRKKNLRVIGDPFTLEGYECEIVHYDVSDSDEE